MRHETALRKLDELDAGEEPSLALRLHLASCRDCARAAKLTREALAAYRGAYPRDAYPREDTRREDTRHEEEAPSEADLVLEARIMAAVRLTPPPTQDFSIGDWITPGLLILISIGLIPFGKDSVFLKALLGPGYALSLSMVLGTAFTVYAAFFIATHLSELESFLSKRGVSLR